MGDKNLCHCGTYLDAYTIAQEIAAKYSCPLYQFQIGVMLEAIAAMAIMEESDATIGELLLLKREIMSRLNDSMASEVKH